LTSAEVTSSKKESINSKDGMTFCIVEHQMGLVMEIADQVAVLDSGRLIAEGPPRVVERNDQVMDAYLKRRSPMLNVKKLMSITGLWLPSRRFSGSREERSSPS
jgi:ABC-type methionine transport system ATPase subunit